MNYSVVLEGNCIWTAYRVGGGPAATLGGSNDQEQAKVFCVADCPEGHKIVWTDQAGRSEGILVEATSVVEA